VRPVWRVVTINEVKRRLFFEIVVFPPIDQGHRAVTCQYKTDITGQTILSRIGPNHREMSLRGSITSKFLGPSLFLPRKFFHTSIYRKLSANYTPISGNLPVSSYIEFPTFGCALKRTLTSAFFFPTFFHNSNIRWNSIHISAFVADNRWGKFIIHIPLSYPY
jgi:hypothetical protein